MRRGSAAIAPLQFNPPTRYALRRGKQTDPPTHHRCSGAVKRKQTMTKTEIIEARTNLVRTIIAIKKLKTQKTALAKTLEPDFEAHEAEYRNGVKTDAGVLVRKPKWNFDAKPVVEVAG